MRRVSAWELVSLDGVMESPEEWAFPYSDAEMGEASALGMDRSDALLLLGRVAYEHLAAYWPGQPGGTPMVDYINSVAKYVVSGTLEEPLGWNNSVLIKGNVAEEIAKLWLTTTGLSSRTATRGASGRCYWIRTEARSSCSRN